MHSRFITNILAGRWPAVVIIVLVLAAGFIYSHHLGERLRYPDEKQYLQIADNLNAGAGYSLDGIRPTAFRPPGYPALLFFVRSLGGNVRAARFVNFFFLATSLFLLFRITERHGGTRAGMIAVTLAAIYPVNIYTAGTLYPQTIATTGLLFIVWLCWDRQTLSLPCSLLAGVSLALVMLLAPSFVFVVIIMCFIGCCLRKVKLINLAALLLAILVTLSPWQVRNFKQFNAFIFVSTNSGVNLLLGNSEHTRPNAGVNVDISRYREAARDMGEVARDRYFRKSAMQHIAENPLDAAGMYVRKFINYFNFRNQLYTQSEASRLRDSVMFLTYVPLLLLMLTRLALIRKRPLSPYERDLMILYVMNGALSAIFFTRIRFRVPFDYLLISLAAIQISHWWSQRESRCEDVPGARAT